MDKFAYIIILRINSEKNLLVKIIKHIRKISIL